ncbi:MAG: hypothetical protein JJ971_06075 [Balneolaceae bacterium]|nr:hypothetical protein [Balneolaceae bacterium]MBO6545945.1 hypothetical protein [Balneolaceae bacterium]MBO6647341.1 hypothetical protein [Balneolaceae bacterium]
MNAPVIIARTMGIVTAFFMVVVSMVMGVSILRDFEHNMESLMFINPVQKSAYLGGRYLGSFVVLLGIFSALLIGTMLGDFMPWKDSETLIPFHFWNYLQPFLTVVLPTLFFGGSFFFVTGALSRKMMVVYAQGILFLILYIFTLQLAEGSGNQTSVTLLDPFSFQTIRELTEFWTPLEKNSQLVPFTGMLLYNRLIWITGGVLALIAGYSRFNFNVVRDKSSKKTSQTNGFKELLNEPSNLQIPTISIRFDIKTKIWQLIKHAAFYCKLILKESSFWVIAACAVATIFINSINLSTIYGVNSYPGTYLIISELIELSIFFFLLIIIFYSGELIWKERDSKFDQIHDALPVSDFTSFAGKFIGLALILALLLLFMVSAGILFQTFEGYHNYDLRLYFMEFFAGIFVFLLLLTFLSFFFQSVLNNKYALHIGVAAFLFTGIGLLNQFGWSHPLYLFGGSFLPTFSEMNGYGHLLEPYFWIKAYWFSFSVMLFVMATLLMVRGTEIGFITRIKLAKQRFTKPLVRTALGAFLFFVCSGSYIFYNTNILNEFSFPSTQKEYRANYEKELKKFEHLPQPKIVAGNLNVDLYPHERDFIAEGYFILVNKHDHPIKEVHIQKPPTNSITLHSVYFERASTLNNTFENYGYYIYTLENPLLPGDSLKMTFKQTFTTKGFEDNSNTDIVYNGTFFSNTYFPSLGYDEDIELEDIADRKEHGLEPKKRRASIHDPIALKEGMAEDDGEEIHFEVTIGTDKNQIAIAPGRLQNQWTEGNRSYFRYKTDQPITNFYSIVSADYEVTKDVWFQEPNEPVNLEIYYQKGHEYNLERMMNGMKKSLNYFSENFSPYQYRQMRIMEFPRYRSFAQSFPNTVPFSEALGFVMDIDDEKDVDMAFVVTAHEVAHQWWGHQVNPANVQGKSMISESLAQYAALMVLKSEYPQEKVHQLLKHQMNRYLKGRSNEEQQEVPLVLVESGQDYIHYGKGGVTLYALQDYISEDSVNLALHRFLRDWNSTTGLLKLQTDRYATTKDLLDYFRAITPDSLQYVIEDLFETITLYENKAVSASYEESSKNQFVVKLEIDVTKLRVNESGAEETVAINDWIDIGIYGTNEYGDEELIYLKKHRITDEFTEIEITVNQKPTKAGIDPLEKLIDRKPEDNAVTISGVRSNTAHF